MRLSVITFLVTGIALITSVASAAPLAWDSAARDAIPRTGPRTGYVSGYFSSDSQRLKWSLGCTDELALFTGSCLGDAPIHALDAAALPFLVGQWIQAAGAASTGHDGEYRRGHDPSRDVVKNASLPYSGPVIRRRIANTPSKLARAHARRCPTCGGHVEADGKLKVNLTTNTAVADGQVIRLSPLLADLLTVLLEVRPRVASHDFLMARLYGTGEMAEMTTLKVMISQLRKRLATTDWSIKSEFSRGYRLAKNGAAA